MALSVPCFYRVENPEIGIVLELPSHKDSLALLLTVACPDLKTAQHMADSLVTEQLAACVQVLPGIRSTYRWQGQLEHSEEVLLLIKTLSAHYPALEARIVELHPYEIPEILAFPASTGYLPYLNWMHECLVPENQLK